MTDEYNNHLRLCKLLKKDLEYVLKRLDKLSAKRIKKAIENNEGEDGKA